MLTIFGLLGALFAGVAADALLSTRSEPDDAADDRPEDDEDPLQGAGGDLLDEPAPDHDRGAGGRETGPVSDDIADPADAPVVAQGGAGDDLLSGGGAADRLGGGAGNDQIDAMAGDDTIDAGFGNDIIWAGDGNDDLYGAAGNDTLHGQAGDDLVTGDFGDDSLFGHDGDDSLAGGAGADALLGGMGDDRLDGGADPDWLAGGEGNDTLQGGAGSDTLDGNAGDDRLSGLDGAQDDGLTDYLNGGDGNDLLDIGAGDHATGGTGADTFALQQWLSEGSVATITDYDFVQDQIVVVYDPAAHPNPQLSLSANDDNDNVTILLDGAPVAVVSGGSVFLSDIRLAAA